MSTYLSAMDGIRWRRAVVPASLLLSLFLFVRACVPEPIVNLRVVEVSRMPASALPSSDDLRGPLTGRGAAVWRVSLRGDAGWIREVAQHELNSYARVVRCDKRDRRVLSLGPYVGQIAVTHYDGGLRNYQPPSRTARYDIYLPETGQYRSDRDFNAPMSSYDFSKQRVALCIRIVGGSMHGAFNRSNEVRVEVGKLS